MAEVGGVVRLVGYWPVDRLSGWRRHGAAVADEVSGDGLVASLLASVGVDVGDVVEFWGTPGIGGDRYVDVSGDYADADLPPHSLAHVFSCALLDTDVASSMPVLAMAVDGGPDSDAVLATKDYPSSCAGAYFVEGRVSWFSVGSPARLFTAARHRFGLREGTLMALASAASCDADVGGLRDEALRELSFSGRAATLLVECERFVGRLHDAVVEAGWVPDHRFTPEEQVMSAVMKEIQRISLAVMERNIDEACDRFGIDPGVTALALAGGFALNCPTNSALMDRYGFARLLTPPCVDDSGQSLGIALGAFFRRCGTDFSFRFPGAYVGHEDVDVTAALAGFEGFIAEVRPASVADVVADLRSGAAVVWLDGRAELGPRALGHRSILADPTRLASKDELNRLKQRQWWRPVAPIIREEDHADWFENPRPSPYMLETFTVRGDREHLVPAIAHLDRSARVQTLTARQDPVLHQILTGFAEATGVPLLCNTSLNDKGEPIIDTIPQAINFCLRKNLPFAYLNQHRITFTNAARYQSTQPLPRTTKPFERDPAHITKLAEQLNPTGLDDLYLHVWLRYPLLRRKFDLTNPRNATILKKTIDTWLAKDPQLRRLFTAWIYQAHNPRTRKPR
ncbi:carbamoyltransferase C-terminal domain-containing protein [Phytohabitans houttuyneae]|uniref:carbamoyltransferase C-terminal domain-containing protein n=1 Tax=Phytohabitans houttuyneae TaxID=1076126 RepID=UPI0015641162|nr:carbamoyltransferase C-terminal domain-containing protein [Phytohabitans houttuyneae]